MIIIIIIIFIYTYAIGIIPMMHYKSEEQKKN